MDNISKLFALRATSRNSVVSQEKLLPIQQQLYVETNFDTFLLNYCKKSKESSKTRLVVLSGNAGDGKSMTLYHTVSKLKEAGFTDSDLCINADATQTDSKQEDLIEKLIRYFENFFIDYLNGSKKTYIIAMNAGIAVKFFYSKALKEKVGEFEDFFSEIGKLILNELNIEYSLLDNNIFVEDVLVCNFDLRALTICNLPDKELDPDLHYSFFKQMIAKVNNFVDIEECKNCISGCCPIYYNLLAIRDDDIAKKIENILFKVFLYNKVHLTPRNLWDFLYMILTGGEEKYLDIKEKTQGIRDKDISPCEIVKHCSPERFSQFLFYNTLFDSASDNAVLSFIKENAYLFDPRYLNSSNFEKQKLFLNADPVKFKDKLKNEVDNFAIDNSIASRFIESAFVFDTSTIKDEEASLDKFISEFSRFYYFFYRDSRNEVELFDILYNYPNQIFNKGNYIEFFDALIQDRQYFIGKQTGTFSEKFLKNGLNALLNIFGINKNQEKLFKIESLSTRAKGRLLTKLDMKLSNSPCKNKYIVNREYLESISYFPSSATIKLNEQYIEIDLSIYELFVLCNNGYNIKSFDADKYYNIEFIGDKIFPDLKNQKKIYYDFQNNYAVFEEDEFGLNYIFREI
jgi:hypothetical protein